MLIEYFDILENKIQYLIEVRSTLKIGDRNYEEHLKTINNNIHLLQVEQDNFFLTNKTKTTWQHFQTESKHSNQTTKHQNL